MLSPGVLGVQVYLTREVGRGVRGLVRGLSLKTRAYVSTTSMDARASVVMANMAQVKRGGEGEGGLRGGGQLAFQWSLQVNR
jgi:tRNA G10  N-methylase Trm11